MITQLRRRLTAILTVMTGIVLTAGLLVSFILACRQIDSADRTYFFSQCNALVQRLTTESSLPDHWLAQMEADNQLLISIRDNGRPIFFPGSYSPASSREELFALAQDACHNVDEDGLFSLQGSAGDSYRGYFVQLSLRNGPCEVILLQSLALKNARIAQTARNDLLLLSLCLLGLWGCSRFVASIAVRPVRRAMQRQAEFVAAAGHELRSPVAAVAANLQALESCPPGSEQARRCQLAAGAENGRLARLVEDLLVLANADAMRYRWDPNELDTDALLIDTFEAFRTLARQRGFRLNMQLPEQPLPRVLGDRQRLCQILTCLLDNATSYAPPGTEILLSGKVCKSEVHLSVTDHGPGVPDTEKEKIFERFARLDQSRAPTGHFGLGLSVAHELAVLHHGRLLCSDTPGGGATFTLILPALP